MAPELSGKVCLVTGGERGIGAAIIDRFLAEGARVLTCGRGPRPDTLPDAVRFETADVSREADVRRLCQRTIAELGRIDVLVNNAGIQIEKPVTETTDADWTALMGANAKGVFLCCRAVIPEMARTGGGSIVNIGSISARAADSGMALYNASKAFVHGLTRSIAVDHGGAGIRCNAIAPGWILTGMAQAAFELADDPEAAETDALRRHPAGRLGVPADIAAMAAWLASDDATFATGQVFVVDGGLTAASPLRPEYY